jgi:peptidoglycan hydrolase-like protein with peptidoglycan-binding domain
VLVSRRLSSNPQLQKAEANNPPLLRGSQGSGVAILQDLLADLGFVLPKTLSRGTADGIFGPETEAAVKAFQKQKSLKADGIAGRMTLGALDAAVTANYRLEAKEGRDNVGLGYW